jgi:hypothetical protein
MKLPLLLYGLGLWGAGTVLLRVAGQRILHPGDWQGTLILFAASFPLTAYLVRRLRRRFRLAPEQWLAGTLSLILPTLLLDPFSSAFFPAVFPNMAPQVAGVFAGWMLWCCAGALLGVSIRWPTRP